MKNSKMSDDDLLEYIQGPDFPTGGIVTNKDELKTIYATGQGKIKLRGRVEFEKGKGSQKDRLVITEIPYTMIGANIGKFLNDVYTLVETKKTNDIIDISNQSSKEGIRIVLELRKNADVEQLKNLLYKKTRLEDTFGVNMLAVADGRPETLSLKSVIEYYLDFQYEITTRKYRTMLRKEMEKKEIQEGLIKACDVIDLIIEILRGSKNIKQAKECLINGTTEGINFKSKASMKAATQLHFTENQASAILEMRLYKLIGLELEALMKEHDTTLKNIAEYTDILENHSSMSRVILRELEAIKKNYARPRRTSIENVSEAVYIEKKIEEMPVVFMMDRFGYARSVDVPTFERNKEAAVNENKYIVQCMNTGKICIFTTAGRMHTIKLTDVPFGRFRDKGTPIDNISNYDSKIESMVYVDDLAQVISHRFVFGTKMGYFKVVAGTEFDVAKRTIAATKLGDGDELVGIADMDELHTIVLQTHQGYFLKFQGEEIPEKKKGAAGVRGIKMGEEDYIEHIYFLKYGVEQMIVYKDKEMSLNKLKLAKRDTKGTKVRV